MLKYHIKTLKHHMKILFKAMKFLICLGKKYLKDEENLKNREGHSKNL